LKCQHSVAFVVPEGTYRIWNRRRTLSSNRSAKFISSHCGHT